MSTLLHRKGSAGLLANTGLAVGLALLGNGIIFFFGWNGDAPGKHIPSFQPAGWVIGAVWTMLFAAMGAARWLTARARQERGRDNTGLITALILACFAYPYYTLGFRSAEIGLIGSLATMLAAAIIAWRVAGQSGLAAMLVLPTALWCAFAGAVLIRTLQIN
jgi:tryptophan-rich sensory protein